MPQMYENLGRDTYVSTFTFFFQKLSLKFYRHISINENVVIIKWLTISHKITIHFQYMPAKRPTKTYL